jgi:hypothetical protein
MVFVLPEAVEAISQLYTHVQPTSVGGSVGALAAAGAAGIHTYAMAVPLIRISAMSPCFFCLFFCKNARRCVEMRVSLPVNEPAMS